MLKWLNIELEFCRSREKSLELPLIIIWCLLPETLASVLHSPMWTIHVCLFLDMMPLLIRYIRLRSKIVIIFSCFFLANPSREFSGSIGNVAWKERVDGWKLKQDKGAIPMTNGTSIAPSEGRGVGDIDASTDYNMEDALLWVLTSSPQGT